MGRTRPDRRIARPVGRSSKLALTVLCVAATALAACGDSGGDDDSGSKSTTTTGPPPFQILVTNDDGYAAPGIDAIAAALIKEPDVEIAVVAPATNQSGISDTTTPGTLTTQPSTTLSGIPATSVAGTPADAVVVALDKLGVEPDLVVSGINFGQNPGPAVDTSGTIGAARTAVRRGIPALAVSQGLGEPPDYETGVARALEWFRANRETLDAQKPTSVTSLNVPTCTTGTVGPTLKVPTATDFAGRDPSKSTCSGSPSATATFADDVDAFIHGYATLSDVPAA
jgi:5'-nucleotidase